ncbi:MAG: fumarate hydratase C-terminal domain-containing protein [candidate division NC10 bacterium]|nr:fumarate hydratase C-terminal domain-containing protein [candidate division NC10 bacterium]MBI2116355.1 fumarate hydratase C-terminal domain-containing protein [candidate division NC10 bacterium]MBI2162934.1 fumarate hydratase C-terminal domain-containing protein [candidate division NC10 bacterium]
MRPVCLETPIPPEAMAGLHVGDFLEISGVIYAGRDAVLPKIVAMSDAELAARGIDLEGSVIFHTAVSVAGVGPTTSSKIEIEESIAPLSARGVRIHLGKGRLKADSIRALHAHASLFAVTTPSTALLTDRILATEIAAFPELGMEALYRLRVDRIPAVVAIFHGESIFEQQAQRG